MKNIFVPLRAATEAIASLMMALMFGTFILQVAVRYSARAQWIADVLPILEPSNFGWTLEFCLALWVWLVFFGNAFVVRTQDHVTFDILYLAVSPKVRKWFVIVTGVVIAVALVAAIMPTMDKFHILRLKKTATLQQLVGGWIRMRDIYFIYIVFLGVVALRYAWSVYSAIRFGVEEPEVNNTLLET